MSQASALAPPGVSGTECAALGPGVSQASALAPPGVSQTAVLAPDVSKTVWTALAPGMSETVWASLGLGVSKTALAALAQESAKCKDGSNYFVIHIKQGSEGNVSVSATKCLKSKPNVSHVCDVCGKQFRQSGKAK